MPSSPLPAYGAALLAATLSLTATASMPAGRVPATGRHASSTPLVKVSRAAVLRRLAAPAKARQIGVVVALGRGLADGAWTLESGHATWRLAVGSDGAQAVAVALTDLRLPAGARLTWTSADGRVTQGPYTSADVPAGGTFYTPMVPGTQGTLSVVLPGTDTQGLSLAVRDVQHVYAMVPATEGDGVIRPKATSGACNVDVACPAGDAWRNEIRATVLYTLVSNDNTMLFACSGSLLNDTANDESPLLYTANHCTSGNQASTVMAYFNFQKAACNGPAMSSTNWSQTQSGATLVASGTSADYALLRLSAHVNTGYNAYFNAWNSSSSATATSGAVMHHPSADVKKISLYNMAATRVSVPFNGATDQAWQVYYSTGTTEEGSSGSNLLNQDRFVIGTLSGGAAACSTSNTSQNNGQNDFYGRLDTAYAESSAFRLALDPVNNGNGSTISHCAKAEGVAGCVTTTSVPPPATGSGSGTGSGTTGTTATTTSTSSGGGGGAMGAGLLVGLAGLGLRRGRRPRHRAA